MSLACVEITNVCNCLCEFCPYPHMVRKKDFMPLELVKKVLDQFAQLGAQQVCLHILGEPTLHPDIEEILLYCAAINLPMLFTSNGTTDRYSSLVPLVKRGTLLYSLQTPQESYGLKGSPITWGKQIDKLRAGLRAFLSTDQNKTVRFEIHLLDTRGRDGIQVMHSDQSVIKIFELLCGVTEDIERELGLPRFPRPSVSLAPQSFTPLQQNVFVHLKGYFAFAGTVSQDINRTERIYCNVPNEQVIVLVNGDVIQCCLTSETSFLVGNVNEQSIMEIRGGERFGELLKRCSGQLPALDCCRKCEMARSVQFF